MFITSTLKKMTCISIKIKDTKYYTILLPFRNDDNRWCIIYGYKRPHSKSQTIYALNRLPIWKHKIKWRITVFRLKMNGELYKRCEGCGEGISEYVIIDPNEPEKSDKILNCCQDCVNFYDWHWSAKNITGWKNGKPKINDKCL